MTDAETIKATIDGAFFYLFRRDYLDELLPIDASLYADVEEDSIECERLNDLAWKIIRDIENIITIDQIAKYIKGLQS